MNVPAATEGSWDNLLHELTEGTNNLLIFKNNSEMENKQLEEQLGSNRRGQRAIGVVYNPEYEMYGNYVPTNLTRRYDAFLHIDKTRALHLSTCRN
jgi:erythromycin esterase